jgi:hypothetical protein
MDFMGKLLMEFPIRFSVGFSTDFKIQILKFIPWTKQRDRISILKYMFLFTMKNSFSLEATKAPNINFSHFPIYVFVWLDSFYEKNSITPDL